MKSIDIIAVTYGQNDILKCFINSIKSQSNPNWRLFIIHDGENIELKKDLLENGYLVDKKVIFYEFPVRTSSYGHKLRKWGLETLAENEYVLITNGDNYYTPNMVDEILKCDEDFIYFDMIHSHKNMNNENKNHYGFMKTQVKQSAIDMGSAAIKTKLAKESGFNNFEFAADWKYFEGVLNRKPTIKKIEKVLFVHN